LVESQANVYERFLSGMMGKDKKDKKQEEKSEQPDEDHEDAAGPSFLISIIFSVESCLPLMEKPCLHGNSCQLLCI